MENGRVGSYEPEQTRRLHCQPLPSHGGAKIVLTTGASTKRIMQAGALAEIQHHRKLWLKHITDLAWQVVVTLGSGTLCSPRI